MRKPTLILKSVAVNQSNNDEVNDIDLIQIPSQDQNNQAFRVAACDDTGATVITDFDASNFEQVQQKVLDTKHQNICYKCKFLAVDQVLTTGFDYKMCLWNLTSSKKSQSTQISSAIMNEIGENAMSYNPPYCYSWDTFTVGQSDQIVLGLGNGMVTRFKRKGLVLEEMHSELHNHQVASMQIEGDLMFTCGHDLVLGVHSKSII